MSDPVEIPFTVGVWCDECMNVSPGFGVIEQEVGDGFEGDRFRIPDGDGMSDWILNHECPPETLNGRTIEDVELPE